MPALTPQQIEDEVRRNIGRGLLAAATFLASRNKETLSVPAPRRRVLGRDGAYYYRATTPATPGAPPRKLSGRLRASQDYQMMPSGDEARVGTNVIYGRVHETGNHPFLLPTLKANLDNIVRIIGREAVR